MVLDLLGIATMSTVATTPIFENKSSTFSIVEISGTTLVLILCCRKQSSLLWKSNAFAYGC
jgi:hypothetical protein